MKDIYKNPIFYYVLIPVVAALWPLLLWTVYSPRAADNWKDEKTQYDKAQKIIKEILTLDPDRLNFAGSKNAAEFDYADAIDNVAGLCKISSGNYKISSGMIIKSKSRGQKNQNAKVILKDVGITQFAKFLSTLQLRWADLQCTKVKLTRKKGLPDSWKVDLDFKYYY